MTDFRANGSDTAQTAIGFLRTTSLSSLVQEEIVRMILSGELDAGAQVKEFAISDRLGVGRSSVREAFRALEEAGLVRLEKNRGVFVREIGDDEAEEMYAVRAGLDELAGRLLAPRITAAEIDELRRHVDELEAWLAPDAFATYFPLNLRFHDRIVEMTGNRKLLVVYRRLINEMHLLRRRGLLRGGGLLVSNDEHRSIVDALASRDADTAAAAMRDHVRSGRDRMLAAVDTATPRSAA
ncbi:MAG: FCD domain-containing protein [Alphaproteobacteria bacterium]|nr:FCD domain-containing protein [Alphaproteobacteria bacterium]